jgi:hypothetical protein
MRYKALRSGPSMPVNPAEPSRHFPSFLDELSEVVSETVEVDGNKIIRLRLIAKNLAVAAENGDMRAASLLMPWLYELAILKQSSPAAMTYDGAQRVKELMLEGLAGVARRLKETEGVEDRARAAFGLPPKEPNKE